MSEEEQKSGNAVGAAVAVGAGGVAGVGTFAALANKLSDGAQKVVETVAQNAPAAAEAVAPKNPNLVDEVYRVTGDQAQKILSRTNYILDGVDNIKGAVSDVAKSFVGADGKEVITNPRFMLPAAEETAKSGGIGGMFNHVKEAIITSGDKFSHLDNGQKFLIIGGTAIAAVGTYVLVDKALNPKPKTEAGTNQYQGQVQQREQGVHVSQ